MSEELENNSESKKLKKNKAEQLPVVSSNCKNCGHHLFLDQRYCPACGSKRIYNRLTARNLGEDFF